MKILKFPSLSGLQKGLASGLFWVIYGWYKYQAETSVDRDRQKKLNISSSPGDL